MRSRTVEGDPAAWVEPVVAGWSSPDRDAAQLLIRQLGAPQGWRAWADGHQRFIAWPL